MQLRNTTQSLRIGVHGAMLVCVGTIDFFFFFQAEDGIRDLTVTGVQTCALPILRDGFLVQSRRTTAGFLERRIMATRSMRSEESRVGKECRSRWSPYH